MTQQAQQHEPEGYDGVAQVLTEAGPVDVTVTLRGAFQPIDGRFHWYGRVVHDGRLDASGRAGADVVLRTPHGQAPGRLSDEDPWGRLRIAGTGRPPYPSLSSRSADPIRAPRRVSVP